ncbi:S-methyl-5'-thioadenosine phosphorylase [bacterium]|nr:MAG: S-methyl-5'-thioadenosine phosphorylase [bacterium]
MTALPEARLARVGVLEGRRVAFLARHGRGHSLLPAELPQRANFWALKSLGVERVLAVSAVGSLVDDYHPGDMAVPAQLIDRTAGQRPPTFFGNGVVAHIAMADPFCDSMRAAVAAAAHHAGATVREGATYVVIEGPAFGTRAESHLYRSWGAHIVGMTALPEARLARVGVLEGRRVAFLETGRAAVRRLLRELPSGGCACHTALDAALVTPTEAIGDAARQRLGPILARRLAVRL